MLLRAPLLKHTKEKILNLQPKGLCDYIMWFLYSKSGSKNGFLLVIHQIMLHVYVIATLAIKVESLIFVIYNHIKIW